MFLEYSFLIFPFSIEFEAKRLILSYLNLPRDFLRQKHDNGFVLIVFRHFFKNIQALP